ncbi:hypothetical protein [Pseudonocardia sp. TRM90224]|uniref:hypothetical protein n=1 Tax=Pseudonocardia sp. TRM90224 TaxID=2812678 RepID=UPI001E48A4E6|nr:hypothetical protein [Pseudonocardia sp. TRM90224]
MTAARRPPHLRVVHARAKMRLVAVPGLGLSVDCPTRTLRLLPSAAGSAAVALPGFGVSAEPGEPLDPAASAMKL